MCGIAGACGTEDIQQSVHAVQSMTDALARRGPDAEGLARCEGAVLGHRRLSIFDLSEAGRQPMFTPDGRVAVVFNGAIYNFHALRDELRSAGYEFHSRTDTEVLLHGYVEWGIDKLAGRLRGMFAFGLWDGGTGTLFLVRDRLGVKPLVYAERGGGIAFASTVAALHAAGMGGDLDPGGVAEFLEFGYVTDNRAIYEGIRKLSPATILEWRNGRTSLRKFWTLSQASVKGPSFDEAVEETERLLLEAVKLRLEADVPVGVLLSAGIDSSLVCWAMAELGANITAFTIGTAGDPLDESREAKLTALQLGLRHELIDLSPDETPQVDEMAAAYGEPFACSSALGMLRVSRAVKASATVLLTGDGGDDVYLGYPEHRHFWHAERLARKLPSFAAGAWRSLRVLVPQRGALRRGSHFLDYATGGIGAVTRAKPGILRCRQAGMLGERLLSQPLPWRDIELSHQSARQLLAGFLAYDHNTRFTGEYLTKVDGATMYYALEARSPFLDQELWEFAGGLPFEIRLRRGILKAVLREIARRRIGERVANGRKRGFGIPATRWLTTRWREPFTEMMRDSLLERGGWLRSKAILQAHAAAIKQGEASLQLWYIYVLEAWMRRQQATSDRRPVRAA